MGHDRVISDYDGNGWDMLYVLHCVMRKCYPNASAWEDFSNHRTGYCPNHNIPGVAKEEVYRVDSFLTGTHYGFYQTETGLRSMPTHGHLHSEGGFPNNLRGVSYDCRDGNYWPTLNPQVP